MASLVWLNGEGVTFAWAGPITGAQGVAVGQQEVHVIGGLMRDFHVMAVHPLATSGLGLVTYMAHSLRYTLRAFPV